MVWAAFGLPELFFRGKKTEFYRTNNQGAANVFASPRFRYSLSNGFAERGRGNLPVNDDLNRAVSGKTEKLFFLRSDYTDQVLLGCLPMYVNRNWVAISRLFPRTESLS
jgi:hypothetical protein